MTSKTIYPDIHVRRTLCTRICCINDISQKKNTRKTKGYTFQNESRWKSYFHELLIYNTEDLYQFYCVCCFLNNRHTPTYTVCRRIYERKYSPKMFCISFCLFFFCVSSSSYTYVVSFICVAFLLLSVRHIVRLHVFCVCVCVCSNNIFIPSCLFSRV